MYAPGHGPFSGGSTPSSGYVVRRCRLTLSTAALKASGTKRLTLNSDEPLSSFAFKFNLRRYNVAIYLLTRLCKRVVVYGRGLHSSTFQLNLSRSGHPSPCPPV